MDASDITISYAKKSALGTYKVVDDEKHTHILFDEENFNKLTKRIVDEEEEYEATIQKLKKELKEKKEALNKAINDNESYIERAKNIENIAEEERNYAYEKLQEAGVLIKEAERIREGQKVEIENIRRIYKETINAARGLKPKKEHTGYCVISSSEKIYRYKSRYGSLMEELLWETILETPYTVDFKPESIRKHFMDDLFTKDEEGRWKIVSIGINGRHFADGEDKEGKYEELKNDEYWGKDDRYEEFNIALEPQIKANYRTGYWEIIFYHTKALDYVPKTWRRGNYR